MVYKNGILSYLFIGVIFALAMIIALGNSNDLSIVIPISVVGGVVMALIMMLFAKNVEKKSEYLRAEVAKVRKIICEGGANLNGVGGWMFLSNDALEFYPHKVNIGGKCTAILIDDIIGVSTMFNVLTVKTKSGNYKFNVNKVNCWKKSIEEIL